MEMEKSHNFKSETEAFQAFLVELQDVFSAASLSQWISAFGFLLCLLALYGEYSNQPSRNVFCVVTKIPTEILAIEMPIVGWSIFWYSATTLISPTSPRVVYYIGMLHFVVISHAMLTLYNSLREIDPLDATLVSIDIYLIATACSSLISIGHVTEVAGVFMIIMGVWMFCLSYHAEQVRRDEREDRSERDLRQFRRLRKKSEIQQQNKMDKRRKYTRRRKRREKKANDGEDQMITCTSTLLR
eukprot:g5600.t1